ncbi:putative serine/threonine protein kinase [Aspergillus candidus]|uniref:non-specific serine/threonine protein kinase n=1 Tax=Aspergillus candidus TaxID=41067 RepID=A0A2I2FN30_ASPCN|nr:protein kinase-like protein [Aspergillus candidus]PLB42025.1 protein kinase-like protein [Aspergillus candidus]
MSAYSNPQSYQSHSASHRPVPTYNPVAAVAAPAGTLLPGTKIQVGSHRVVVEKYLSEGGFAHVYVVRLSNPVDGSDRTVLKRVAVPDKAALANMRTEVETMKRLKGHRHIVKYIDSHASQLRGGGYEVFLLMEYCSGGGLIDFMNTRLQNRLTEPEIVKIFADVAEGVACMHYLKPPLLHRDLKVENVLISRHGGTTYYKLCDFGSAAPPRPAATSAAEGRLIEDDVQRHTTLQYRSPEMIDVYRRQPIDEKSDIWALGVLLYKLCYYTTPFEEVGQMAILNASYKFPNYPVFSDRLRMLISWMLKENPQKRPNIYEVLREACHMQGRDVPIKDIYAHRSKSEARRYQELPSPTDKPQVGAVFSPPVQETHIIPEIAPMRRGRPTRPSDSQQPSAHATPSPYRGSADPFAVLDGGNRSRNSTDEFTNRFPSLDQFDILHEKGDKFEFDATVAESKDDDGLSQRLTNALADDAFAKHPVSGRESEAPAHRRRQPSPAKKRTEESREEPSRSAVPLYQPVPHKPAMVSTGTMTSPPETPPALPESHSRSRPIFRFASSDSQRRPASQQWAAEEEEEEVRPPLPARVPSSRLEPLPRKSAEGLSNLPASSRPSFEALRPSARDLDDHVGRSKSANSGTSRPVSMQAGPRLEMPRASDSARSSLDRPRSPYEIGEPRTETERANMSDIEYLRAREEEESNRKREKRHSANSKHAKRSSLSTLSLANTKTIFAGRFGDAFRRFEQTDGKAQSPAGEEPHPKYPVTVNTEEVTTVTAPGGALADDYDEDDDDDTDISPEMRRELERRRLSQEEKRVAQAAAEYRRQVAEGGAVTRDPSSRSSAIQNRVQSLLSEGHKPPPPPKTATGYGRFTEESTPVPHPALQAKPTSNPSSAADSRIHTRSALPFYTTTTTSTTSPSAHRGAAAADTVSPLPDRWEGPPVLPRQETATTQRTGSSTSRPPAPPKPKNLRSDRPTSRDKDDAVYNVDDDNNPGDSPWEANFSRRFPSLAGLEMVETEIEIPRMASLRTKEV